MVLSQGLHTIPFRWNRRSRNKIAIMRSLMVSSNNEFGEALGLKWVLRPYNQIFRTFLKVRQGKDMAVLKSRLSRLFDTKSVSITGYI